MKFLVVFAGLVAYAAAVDIGGYCTANSDCTTGNDYCDFTDPCTTGLCACSSGYTAASSTSCVAIVYKNVGESCSGTYDVCRGDYTSCSSSTCACLSGMTGSSGDSDCSFPTQKNIGESCTYSVECAAYKYQLEQDNAGVAPYSTASTASCSSSVCACATNYQANSANTRCVSTLAAFGASCSVDADCDTATYPGITCESGTCGCVSGMSQSNGAWSIYDYYENSCYFDGSTIVAKGATCSTSSSPYKYCGKGQTCGTCPNSSSNICMDGAEHIQISFVLLTAALFFYKLFA